MIEKKITYNLTERLLTWQKGSGDCKCDLGPEEKEGWNKWKMLSSSSLWPGLGPFFSFLKTHIRFNPDIGTFTPPNILHLISDRPCVINLCKRVSIGFAKVRGSGKDRDHAKAAAGMKTMQACQPQLLGMFYLPILFVIVNLSHYK